MFEINVSLAAGYRASMRVINIPLSLITPKKEKRSWMHAILKRLTKDYDFSLRRFSLVLLFPQLLSGC